MPRIPRPRQRRLDEIGVGALRFDEVELPLQLDEGWLEEVDRPDGVHYQASFCNDTRTFEREWQAMSWLDNKRHSIKITPEGIQDWALKEVDLARALGLRLLQHQDANSLLALPPLGPIEDRITSWAIENPLKARLLMIRLSTTVSKSKTTDGQSK